MSFNLRLSLSQPTDVRWVDIRYNQDGAPTDPRPFFTPQFQLIDVDSAEPESFGTWADGEWEDYAPVTGPYAARLIIGPGQPSEINPGVAGIYRLWGRMFQVAGPTPAFRAGVITLAAP